MSEVLSEVLLRGAYLYSMRRRSQREIIGFLGENRDFGIFLA